MTTGWGLRIGEAVLGGVVLGLGLFIAIETSLMEVAASNAAIGPRLFPFLIAFGLLAVGVPCSAQAFFGHIAHERGFELDWRRWPWSRRGLIAADAAGREPGLDHRHHAPVRRRPRSPSASAGC